MKLTTEQSNDIINKISSDIHKAEQVRILEAKSRYWFDGASVETTLKDINEITSHASTAKNLAKKASVETTFKSINEKDGMGSLIKRKLFGKSKFKKGDKVKAKSGIMGKVPAGATGTIKKVIMRRESDSPSESYKIDFGKHGEYEITGRTLEKVGDEKEIKESKFETHVICGVCNSDELEVSTKGGKVRCKKCGYTDLTENILGIKK